MAGGTVSGAPPRQDPADNQLGADVSDSLPDPASVRIVCDGQEFGNWRVLDDSTVELSLDVDDHDLIVATTSRSTTPRTQDAGRTRQSVSTPSSLVAPTPIGAPPTARRPTMCGCCG